MKRRRKPAVDSVRRGLWGLAAVPHDHVTGPAGDKTRVGIAWKAGVFEVEVHAKALVVLDFLCVVHDQIPRMVAIASA